MSGDKNRYYGFEIRNCPGWAIQVLSGAQHEVARCYIHDNGNAVQWSGSDSIFGPGNRVTRHGWTAIQVGAKTAVHGNRLHDNGGPGMVLGGAAQQTVVWGNVIAFNGLGLDLGANANNIRVLHNTIHGNAGVGVDVHSNVGGLELRNNVISHNAEWGVEARDSNFAARTNNAYYRNRSDVCSGCTTPDGSQITADPRYIDTAAGDLRLQPGSPLINAGTDTGLDVNGAAQDKFNGAAPDIGAWESP
jgi:hypothetical protein